MKEAKNLLAETQISAQDIGLQLGFSSGANFSTAFKDYFGMTPAEFRSQKTS
ncbi:MAG: helix-turn-helix domain-containing protein, partial [Oceanospirillales bacterium]